MLEEHDADSSGNGVDDDPAPVVPQHEQLVIDCYPDPLPLGGAIQVRWRDRVLLSIHRDATDNFEEVGKVVARMVAHIMRGGA